MKKGALFCLKGLIKEPKPTKKGIRAQLGILVNRISGMEKLFVIFSVQRVVETVSRAYQEDTLPNASIGQYYYGSTYPKWGFLNMGVA